jgi:hypothetical protein
MKTKIFLALFAIFGLSINYTNAAYYKHTIGEIDIICGSANPGGYKKRSLSKLIGIANNPQDEGEIRSLILKAGGGNVKLKIRNISTNAAPDVASFLDKIIGNGHAFLGITNIEVPCDDPTWLGILLKKAAEAEAEAAIY